MHACMYVCMYVCMYAYIYIYNMVKWTHMAMSQIKNVRSSIPKIGWLIHGGSSNESEVVYISLVAGGTSRLSQLIGL